jgi:serine protease
MQKARLFAVAAVSALLAACSSGGNQVVPPAQNLQPSSADRGLTPLSRFTARDEATGTIVHVLPTRDVFSATASNARATQSTNTLLYGGGPVQTAPKIYVVFWGSAWNGSGDPNGVKNQLINFYNAIGGSRWLNSVTQYTQSNGQHAGNSGNILGGYYVDTSSSPPSRPSQSQMAAEAARAAAHFGARGLNVGSYVVAMPHGISPSGFGTQYCAYHSTTSASGTTIAWTNLPYMPDAGTSCGAGSVNSPGTLDGVTIVGGHEQGETETDPGAGNGWTSSGGSENGDLCAWTNLYNNSAAGGYPTQPLWSNANNGCVQSY